MKRIFGTQDSICHMVISSSSMKLLMSSVLVLAVSGVAGCQRTTPSLSSEAGKELASKLPSATSGHDFLLLLQRALQNNDRDWVMGAIRFPVQVNESGTVLERPAFVHDYDKVWNTETVQAVLKEAPDHFASGDHFIVGCGEVWFEKTENNQFMITAFNISAYSNAGIPLSDCYRAREFVQELQAAIATGNRDQVASKLKYPLDFKGHRKIVTLHSPSEALQNYDLIFSDKLRRAIAEQQAWNLMSSSAGVAIGDGLVWITEASVNGQFKVVSIFEP